MTTRRAPARRRRFVASGGYSLGDRHGEMTLKANEPLLGRPPAITAIECSPTSAARAPSTRSRTAIDYARSPTSMRRGSPTTRPSGRSCARSGAVDRLLRVRHDTPPFDDVRVRRAFAARSTGGGSPALAVADPDGSRPRWSRPGSPAGATRDVLPRHDPDAARALSPRPASRGRGLPGRQRSDGRLALRRGGRRRGKARARGHAQVRGHGLRRRTSTGSTPTARDVVSCRGSPTTPAATTSWACCSARVRQQLRALELAGVRRRDRRRGAATDAAAAAAAYDRAEDIVQRDARSSR